jgi:enamine deaminase RidA (YjgF/YER057c/UK114 family)
MHRVLQPPDWPRPSGYANGVAARGVLVFVAGQIGWRPDGVFESDDLVDQTRQALENVCAVLAEAGAAPEHITMMTWYLTDRNDYKARLTEIGAAWRSVLGKVFPPMAVVEVAGLVEERARIEIQVSAVVPDRA